MTAMDIAQGSELGHRYLEISSIDISKTNPRKHFDKTKLAELTESIVRHGVLQPILVRPKGTRFELVAGERRLRATRDGGIGKIPAIVRELDDKSTLEIQVVENLQREDLHPLEEAEGYTTLIHSHGYDADSLALKIGKSRSYVYGRMKLAELCAPAKKAMWDEKLSHSVALLVARIPDAKLQAEALRHVVGDHFSGAMSYRRASEFIQQQFMLRLDKAPFDRASAELVPAAGACATCPHRTGNQSELFDDVKSADVCTKPSCYQEKAAATLQLEAKEKGWKSLTAEQSQKIFRNGSVGCDAAYVDAKNQAGEIGNYSKTYEDALPKSTPIVLAVDDKGQVHKLYRKRDLPKRKERRTSAPRSFDDSKWKSEQEARTAIDTAIAAALVKKITPSTKIGEMFPAFVAAIVDDRGWIPDNIMKAFALPKRGKGSLNSEGIVEYIRGLKPQQRILACAGILFFDNYHGTDEIDPAAQYFFTAVGVDAEKIRAATTAALQEKWDAKKKKSPRKGKRS